MIYDFVMPFKTKHIIVLSSVFVLLTSFFLYKNLNAQTLTESETVSIGAIVGSIPSIDTGPGGGTYQSGVRFSGLAYPKALVTVQKRDTTFVTVVADETGAFSILIPETSWQLFTLFAVDTKGRKSTLLNFPTILYSGYITDISGIRFAPTLVTDKISVKRGDFITFSGSALPNKEVEVSFEGEESKTFYLTSDDLGFFSATVPLDLKNGEYVVRAFYSKDSRTSKALRITIGNSTILRNEATNNIPGDCNFDQNITLVDFSVLAFWYGKQNPPKCVDANSDRIVNLIDFSIVAFYWNG